MSLDARFFFFSIMACVILTHQVTYWFVAAAIAPNNLYDKNIMAKMIETHKLTPYLTYLAIKKTTTNKIIKK